MLTERPLLVLDPFLDPKWQADYITDDPEKYRAFVKANQDCELVIDEGGKTIGRYAKEMTFLATDSRHYGHVATFIAQRRQQLDRNVADQCSRIFIFSVAPSDAKIFAEDFVDKAFLECPDLEQGWCVAKRRFKPAFKLNVFDLA